MSKTETKWAWLKSNGDPQDDLFDNPNDAITEMRKRMGWDEPLWEMLNKIHIKLAMVKVTIEPIAVLEWPKEVDKKPSSNG